MAEINGLVIEQITLARRHMATAKQAAMTARGLLCAAKVGLNSPTIKQAADALDAVGRRLSQAQTGAAEFLNDHCAPELPLAGG